MLEIDVFNGVVAGVFLQLHLNSKWYPVTFFLKIIALIKCNYEMHDKKMLAII